jgi:hypothetical protein
MYHKQFKSEIFMGCSHPGSTESNMLNAHRLLDEAFSILGGAQQNGGMGTTFDKKEDKQNKENLDAIAEDIVMALTGKKIKL